MRVGLLGTRGVPAHYGGFETAVEEIGSRLAARGHEVLVYCRDGTGAAEHRGMRLVHQRAVHARTLETLSHTAASVRHARTAGLDVAIVFNAANSPLVPALRAAGTPVAIHVDGLEWKRAKWAGVGRFYYRRAEAIAVAFADCLIADAEAIVAYYRGRFGVECTLLRYGAPVLEQPPLHRLGELSLTPKGYHLAIARLEPENNIHLIVEGYRDSRLTEPLVVVGAHRYPTAYTRRLDKLLASDRRVRAIGAVYDQELIDALYAGAMTYAHGHSVGGTNPSLLRAMGAGTLTLASDNPFNREVLDSAGWYFRTPADLTGLYHHLATDPGVAEDYARRARERAEKFYDWDEVAAGYEQMCLELAAGGRRGGAMRRLARTMLLRPPRTGVDHAEGHGNSSGALAPPTA